MTDDLENTVYFWIDTKADGVIYPGELYNIKLPSPKKDVKRVLVISLPEETIDREDFEIIIQLGDANLLITGKDRVGEDNKDSA